MIESLKKPNIMLNNVYWVRMRINVSIIRNCTKIKDGTGSFFIFSSLDWKRCHLDELGSFVSNNHLLSFILKIKNIKG